MKRLEKYKAVLSQHKESGYKLLTLIEYYEKRGNTKGLETLTLALDAYSVVDDKGIEIKFPEKIEEKINTLYTKKINTFSFGTKKVDQLLDELINEND